jgi:hypothetical protein
VGKTFSINHSGRNHFFPEHWRHVIGATVVRALLLAAVVALLGRWNWWMPRPLARVMRVPAPAPLRPRPAIEGAAGE